MYAVRMKSVKSISNVGPFASRLRAQSNCEVGQDQVLDGELNEVAPFRVASTCDDRKAVKFVLDGKAALLEMYPRP